MDLLDEFKLLGMPGGIERREAIGQADLVSQVILPKQGDDEGWEILKQWGVKQNAEYDELFWSVELPAGWTLIPDKNYYLYSNLVCDRGFNRAEMYYKAVIYDRRAHISVYDRFTAHGEGDHFMIKDNGLKKEVGRLKVGSYGRLKTDPSKNGFVFGDEFYFNPSYGDRFQDTTKASFAEKVEWPDLLENEVKHRSKGAAGRISKKQGDTFLENLPEGDRWTHEYTQVIADCFADRVRE